MRDEPLFDLVADRQARVQRAEGILEDDLHAAAKLTALFGAAILEPLSVKPDLARRCWLQAERHTAERRLSRARLTDDRQCLAARDGEVDAIDGLDRLAL